MNWNKYTAGEIILIVVLLLGLIFGLMCLFAWWGMLLWNALMPAMFGLGTITFWQAFGIKLLVTFLLAPMRIGSIGKNDD